MRGGNRVTHREISPVAKARRATKNWGGGGGKNSPVIKARRATKGYCPKAKELQRPKAKQNPTSPKAKERDRQRSVFTIVKRGVEGGETVCSDWLQQTVRKIGGRKHGDIGPRCRRYCTVLVRYIQCVDGGDLCKVTAPVLEYAEIAACYALPQE